MKIQMVVVQGRPAGKTLTFPIGEYYFGRGNECQVRPNSEWVSRQHCLLRVTATGVYLRDLGSRNGTLVNGTLLHEECQLQHGDQVQLGPLVFQIQLENDTPARHEDTNPAVVSTKLSSPEPATVTSNAGPPLESSEDLQTVPYIPVRKQT